MSVCSMQPTTGRVIQSSVARRCAGTWSWTTCCSTRRASWRSPTSACVRRAWGTATRRTRSAARRSSSLRRCSPSRSTRAPSTGGASECSSSRCSSARWAAAGAGGGGGGGGGRGGEERHAAWRTAGTASIHVANDFNDITRFRVTSLNSFATASRWQRLDFSTRSYGKPLTAARLLNPFATTSRW